MEKIKKAYPTSVQKKRLLALLEADEELRQGKFSSSFTKNVAESRWYTIANELNSIPGAKKDWKEWRKTWQDIKAKAKKKQSAISRAQNLTGGGPPPPPLSEEDTFVLRTMSEAAVIGHQDSQESAVEFLDLPGTSTTSFPDFCISPPTVMITIEENENSPPVQYDESLHKEKHVKEATAGKIQKKRKTLAVKRLNESIDIAKLLNKNLQEKNEIKKSFYSNFLIEMHRQTEALQNIANNLSHH